MKADSDHFLTARFEKGQRYYTLLLEQDLLSDWVISRIYGRKGTRLGQILREPQASYEVGCKRFQALVTYRQKRRRYQRIIESM